MSQKCSIGLFVFLLALGGCKVTAPLYFSEPQPAGVKNKPHFRKKFLGTYRCDKDSCEIIVSRSAVVIHTQYQDTLDRDLLDSLGFEFRGNYAYYPEMEDSVPVSIRGESVWVEIDDRDTIFHTDAGILRYYKKSYFLNTKKGPERWTVRILALGNEYSNNGTDREKVLVVRRFCQAGKKKILPPYMDVGWDNRKIKVGASDSTLSPTKKQLRSLMETRSCCVEYKCRKERLRRR